MLFLLDLCGVRFEHARSRSRFAQHRRLGEAEGVQFAFASVLTELFASASPVDQSRFSLNCLGFRFRRLFSSSLPSPNLFFCNMLVRARAAECADLSWLFLSERSGEPAGVLLVLAHSPFA